MTQDKGSRGTVPQFLHLHLSSGSDHAGQGKRPPAALSIVPAASSGKAACAENRQVLSLPFPGWGASVSREGVCVPRRETEHPGKVTVFS